MVMEKSCRKEMRKEAKNLSDLGYAKCRCNDVDGFAEILLFGQRRHETSFSCLSEENGYQFEDTVINLEESKVSRTKKTSR